jgi:DNA replication protein DnaC
MSAPMASAPTPCRACGQPRQTIAGLALPCRPCSDLAAALDDARRQAEAAGAAAVAHEKAVCRWLASVPARFRWATVPTPPELASRVPEGPRAAAAAMASPASVLLAGRSGTGKSSLAAHTVSRWARDGARCLWLSCAAVDELQRASKLGAEEQDELHRAKRVPVLVLDDLGTDGKLGAEAIVSIMHRRHDADLVTVATTGLTSADLSARYGAGVVRRIAGDGVVRMGGEKT